MNFHSVSMDLQSYALYKIASVTLEALHIFPRFPDGTIQRAEFRNSLYDMPKLIFKILPI